MGIGALREPELLAWQSQEYLSPSSTHVFTPAGCTGSLQRGCMAQTRLCPSFVTLHGWQQGNLLHELTALHGPSHSVERQSEFRLCPQQSLGHPPRDTPQSPCFNRCWGVNLCLSYLPQLGLSWASEQEDNYGSPKRSRYRNGPLLRPVFESCLKCQHSQGSDQALLTLLALLMFPGDSLGVIQYFLWIFMPENQAKSLHCIFQPPAQDIASGRVPLRKSRFIAEYGSPAASVSFAEWPGCKRLSLSVDLQASGLHVGGLTYLWMKLNQDSLAAFAVALMKKLVFLR